MEESDYIKRSIEFYKYMFSSSAALFLILAWKIFTEIDFKNKAIAITFTSNGAMAFLVALFILCLISVFMWMKFIKELE